MNFIIKNFILIIIFSVYKKFSTKYIWNTVHPQNTITLIFWKIILNPIMDLIAIRDIKILLKKQKIPFKNHKKK